MRRRTSVNCRTISNIPQKSHNFSVAPGFEGKIFLTTQGLLTYRIDSQPYNPNRIEAINKISKSKFNKYSLKDITFSSKKIVSEKSDELKYI